MRRSRRPKLGQHFLSDSTYRQRVVEALALRPDDLVVEIGAGRGEMTDLLAERVQRVVAIELDAALAKKLREKARNNSCIEVIQTDVLTADVADVCRRHHAEKCFVFGNLPYYITSPILHRLLGFSACIRAMAFLVQREVGQRLVASPGTRAYGYLSVFAQLYSNPYIVLHVPPGAFTPRPKVYSTLVYFEIRSKLPGCERKDEPELLEFAKRCFAKKRKNLLNNLAGPYPRPVIEATLKRLSLPSSVRAEQLAVEQLVSLFHHLGQTPGRFVNRPEDAATRSTDGNL